MADDTFFFDMTSPENDQFDFSGYDDNDELPPGDSENDANNQGAAGSGDEGGSQIEFYTDGEYSFPVDWRDIKEHLVPTSEGRLIGESDHKEDYQDLNYSGADNGDDFGLS
ncbi:hypothetical protein [Flexibacterium corallicola]|uniref:hypothetical protein n=1 Tax=Flexibacterium corallicola TaxID=3037259 RepID=UPI00286F8BAA|nr:hypothetical protein [Pseudovibrio sp. M1P-2-3]